MRPGKWLVLIGVLLVIAGAHAVLDVPSEPFFNNDETRHVMTGVFFRDALSDTLSNEGARPLQDPKTYAVRYYLQYPALGLLTWPPFFYMVEGLAMSVFGISALVGKVLVAVFAGIACGYLFCLVHRTLGLFSAATATLLFGLSPLCFTYSRQVMLEMPTLACGMAAVVHAVSYLDGNARKHLWLAALTSALAALTRFDGVYLLPLFGILLVARRQLGVLRRWQVWLAAAAALALVAPYYLLTIREFGWVHLKAAADGTSGTSTDFMELYNFWFYLRELPAQIGWFALAAAALGLPTLLNTETGAAPGRFSP